jgi:hypothetical protein
LQATTLSSSETPSGSTFLPNPLLPKIITNLHVIGQDVANLTRVVLTTGFPKSGNEPSYLV